MDFYLDEQLPKTVAEALNAIEKHEGVNSVFSTEEAFGKGVPDTELFTFLTDCNGILITNDLKMKTRKNEFSIIKNLGVTVFIISLPSGVNYQIIYKTIIDKWEEIKKICKKNSRPFVCRIKMRGESEFL